MSEQRLRPVPRPGVMEIEAYVPGGSAAPGGVRLHKLSSNETPFGASPHAQEAIRQVADHLELYPDGQSTRIRAALAARYGLNAANLVCGNGSGELLGYLAQVYLREGDEGIYTEHGFLLHRTLILATGAKAVMAPERDERVDVDAILARVTERTRLVFLTNPGNPTGTYVPADEVRRLHAALPGNVVLVLDSAYAEYVRRNDYDAGVELVAAADNVVMTRTFSKVHGLAALRVGWMFAPAAIVDAVERIRGPFNINAVAIAAATAAVGDREHVEHSVRENLRWLETLTTEFEELGLRVTPSVANFLLIHFPETAGRTAAEADAFLTARGFILRRVAGYGFPNALRMTVGSAEANRGVAAALAEFMTP